MKQLALPDQHHEHHTKHQINHKHHTRVDNKRNAPLKVLANGKLGSCGTFPRPLSTFFGSIVNTC